MADSSLKKETMIRLKDLSGAQECMGAEALIRSRMVWRLSARKISVSRRLVMRSVFEGGVGNDNGGTVDKSSESGVRGLDDLGEEASDILEGRIGGGFATGHAVGEGSKSEVWNRIGESG